MNCDNEEIMDASNTLTYYGTAKTLESLRYAVMNNNKQEFASVLLNLEDLKVIAPSFAAKLVETAVTNGTVAFYQMVKDFLRRKAVLPKDFVESCEIFEFEDEGETFEVAHTSRDEMFIFEDDFYNLEIMSAVVESGNLTMLRVLHQEGFRFPPNIILSAMSQNIQVLQYLEKCGCTTEHLSAHQLLLAMAECPTLLHLQWVERFYSFKEIHKALTETMSFFDDDYIYHDLDHHIYFKYGLKLPDSFFE